MSKHLKKRSRKVGFILFLFFQCIGIVLHGQTKDEGPKIGLVLSGGGAKGLAHIGVLKAMEEAGIYPDVITGTSMGSIVGGLYALGYSADEIQAMALEANWKQLLSNQVPFYEISFEEKDYYGRYIVELPLNGLSPQLPSGIIESQNLSSYFDEVTRAAHGIDHFDDLPIPFKCVATDISTGHKVVLDSGSLVQAMRASMAIPSVFTPVEIDDKLLVDGGLVRNFPVQEALDMGADIIIGSFVSDDLSSKEDLKTLTAILLQSAWVMSAYDSREQIKLVDLYIDPDLEPFSTGSFGEAKRIIDRGMEAGEAAKPQLNNLFDSLTNIGKAFTKPVKPVPPSSYFIADIAIQGNETISSDLILGKLGIASGLPVSISQINDGIRNVYGTRLFKRVNYRLVPSNQSYKLQIQVDEKPQVHLQTAVLYNNEVRAGINFNIIARNVLGKDSRTLFEIDLAQNLGGEFNYLKYLGAKRTSALTLGYEYQSADIPIFDNGAESSLFNLNRNNFFLSIQDTRKAVRTYGVRADAFLDRYKPVIGGQQSGIKSGREESISTGIFWNRNTLDRLIFPSNGIDIQTELSYIFYNETRLEVDSAIQAPSESAESFIRASFLVSQYVPIARRLILIPQLLTIYENASNTGVRGVTSIGGFFNNYSFTVPFWGLKFSEFQATSFGMFNLGLQYEVITDLFLIGRLNYVTNEFPARWINPSQEISDFNGRPDVFGGGLSLGYRSIFGPISVSIGKSNQSNKVRTGLNIGFWL